MSWRDDFGKKFVSQIKYGDAYGEATMYDEPFEVMEFIESLLKKQRENCAKTYDEYDSHYENFENILNAPEPEGDKK